MRHRFAALTLAFALIPTGAAAVVFEVDSTEDSVDAAPGDGVCADALGACTLRAAVMETNALPGPDEVRLVIRPVPPASFPAHHLEIPGAGEDAGATGDLDVLDDLLLVGVSGGVRVGGGPSEIERTLDVIGRATLTVRNLELRRTAGTAQGHTVRNRAGTLRLRSVRRVSGSVFNGGFLEIDATTFISGTVENTGSTVVRDSVFRTRGDPVFPSPSLGGDVAATVYTTGTLRVERTLFQSANFSPARGAPHGAAIFNVGQAVVRDSIFTNNGTADFRAATSTGGAVLNEAGGELLLLDTELIRSGARRGSGLVNFGVAHVSRSSIRGGVAAQGAGGVLNEGELVIEDSTVLDNLALGGVGGIENHGDLRIARSRIAANDGHGPHGGGILNTGALWIEASTLDRNSGARGAGISNSGVATVVNTTITGNRTSGAEGGGIENLGTLELLNATVTDNDSNWGGGLFNAGEVAITNSILAGNRAPTGPDCADFPGFEVSSLGHNVVGIVDRCSELGLPSDQLGSPAAPLDARLGPLADNGGPTSSRAPEPGSPALDRGSPAAPGREGACAPLDQRGLERPVDGDGDGTPTCDVGAVELGELDTRTCRERLDDTEDALSACLEDPRLLDADGDGVPDAGDVCPASARGAAVDSVGCSRPQFCSAIGDGRRALGLLTCLFSDWRNDEPLHRLPRDCALARDRGAFRCVAR